jgi:levansucrase
MQGKSMSSHGVIDFKISATGERPASFWRAEHVAAIADVPLPQSKIINADLAAPLSPQLSLWDIWPVQLDDGSVAPIANGSLWVMLSAPRKPDPDERHSVARMRLIYRHNDRWIDCGDLLPDGFSPGSREWSGSTRFDPKTNQVTLWFTAAGRVGATEPNFEQRLFQAVGQLDLSGALPKLVDWTGLTETVSNDGRFYADLRTDQGVPGRIKGFRDPYWFRDPADGRGYILFTGSKPSAKSNSAYNGVIGIAAATDDDGFASFSLLPPIIDGDGVVNELERPHMIFRDGQYYLFWSSQRSVFAPGGPAGPTGLYGMVGASPLGPFTPLNGTGLVVANPDAEPRQAYAWQVLPSLEIVSFVDHWGLKGRDIAVDPLLKAAQFGGTIAPIIKITIDGATTSLVDEGHDV